MKGKTVAITGASSGLGRALALRLAREGAHLSLFARDISRLQKTAEECEKESGGNAPLIIAGDVREEDDCRSFIKAAAEKTGRLDCLINNAGISMWARAADCETLSAFRAVTDTVFWGAAQCAHAALPHLRGGGMIVNISSVQGKTALPYHTIYAAGKHALEGFFDSLAMEEPQIHILTVRPGWINGTRINQNRAGNKNNAAANNDNNNGNNDNGNGGIPVNECAEKIITAIKERRQTLTLPERYKWLPLLAELFPQTVRRAATKKTEARRRRPPRHSRESGNP